MAVLGRAALILALATALFGVGASLYGARHGARQWVDAGRRSVYALVAILALAFAILEGAFVANDFAYNTVANNSSLTTPLFYRVAAMWGSQEGSLLLWVFLLSIWSSVAVFLTRNRLREIVPYAVAVLLGFASFFTAMLVFFASPFDTTSPAPVNGAGLDPLLRFPSMMIHPPMLYSGYTFFAIPFAFAVGALITRRFDAEWIPIARRFALASWLFLGIGIVLGARWAYAEIGWGGYWGWDAVENAALMPWLVQTAFLHSIMIQEKRGMLKVWNASLVLAASTLAIVGTFLVRSGILSSIHAFGASTLGVPFVILIAAMVLGSFYLVVSRRDHLRSEHHLDSLISREAAFMLNNLVFVGLVFVIFWGTFFPLVSQLATGTQSVVGTPWFDRYTVPLALLLVLLSGVGPIIPWRRATGANARRNFALPLLAAGLMLIASFTLVPISSSPPTVALFCCAVFVFAAVGQEFWRGLRARRAMSGERAPLALLAMVRRNRRRYGGYIVHLGVAVLLLGVAASSTFAHTQFPSLAVGQSATVGGYTMTNLRPTAKIITDPTSTGALLTLGSIIRVTKDGRYVTTLHPTAEYYPDQTGAEGPVGSLIGGDSVSTLADDSSLRRDISAAIDAPTLEGSFQRAINAANRVVDLDKLSPARETRLAYYLLAVIVHHYLAHPPAAPLKIASSPLVMWLWLGALIVFAGGFVAIWPPPGATRRVRARYLARVAQELGRA
ncbi:MAG TPA: cytochrome c-type biogenesis CcmF C-terminal domain-containing protein [Solirubrobacteraceae bacterium]|nr:cytochrome c-type biogenesis CcmF C-terminal domain-containing protein [Solirubrobacteraceae bacterium]